MRYDGVRNGFRGFSNGQQRARSRSREKREQLLNEYENIGLSGAELLKPSQAALDAAKAGDWSVMRAESAAWAKGDSGDVPVFFGNGKGRIFLNDELPELLKK
jgi:hypothetical protein